MSGEPQVIEPVGPKCAVCGRVCQKCRRQTAWDAMCDELARDPSYRKVYNATLAGDLRKLTRAGLVSMLMRVMGKREPRSSDE